MGLLQKFLATDTPINDQTLSLTSPQFVSMFGSLHTASGQMVTPQKALRCAVSLACVKTLIDDVCKMPLVLMEEAGDDQHPAVDDSLYTVLHDAPNDEMTDVDLRSANMLDLLTTGNFYNQIIRTDGSVSELWPLCASYVVSVRIDGNLAFRYTDPVTHLQTTFPKEQIWRCNLMSQNGIDGQSLVLLAREAFGMLLALEQQAGKFHSNGANIMGTLEAPAEVESDAKVDDAGYQKVLDEFVKNYSGSEKAFHTALLPYGIKFNQIKPLTAQESQFIEGRNFQAADIARIFGGAAMLVKMGLGEMTPTFASVDAYLTAYDRDVITPYTNRIEKTIRRDLLLPNERATLYARHNHNSVLRGDQQSRYAAYQIAIDKGWMSPNDVLTKEDQNKIPGLDWYHVNQNAIFDPKAGKIITVGTNKNAPAVEDENDPTGAPAAPAPVAPPTAVDSNVQFKALATAQANRVLRANKKAAVDAKFISGALAISQEKADAFHKTIDAGWTDEQFIAKLVALAMEN